MIRGIGLRYGVSLAALLATTAIATTAAQAGSFGIREQSAYYQGMSFAGEAVGNDLSSMFWNPAATASVNGINSSSNFTGVFVDSSLHADGGVFYLLNANHESGSLGDPTLVPASYFNYQVNDRLYLGMALNSPFGFATKPDNVGWSGSPIATSSRVLSVNANPNFAYKLTPTLTVGAGLQVEYFDVKLKSGATPPGFPLSLPGRSVEGDDIGLGATAGITWKPAAGTQIGLGYRSAVDIGLEGRCSGVGLSNAALGGCGAGTNVNADLTLPDVVSFGLRQQLTKDVAFMGTVEWTRWSSLGTIMINSDATGKPVDALPLNYKDGWFVSGGLEYAYDPNNTFRMGIGWEKSPITDEIRNVFLPDTDRVWLSVGSSHKITDKLSVDLAYTHIIMDDGPISVNAKGIGNLLTADVETKINIVSLGLKYKWSGAEPELEPLK